MPGYGYGSRKVIKNIYKGFNNEGGKGWQDLMVAEGVVGVVCVVRVGGMMVEGLESEEGRVSKDLIMPEDTIQKPKRER